jgi:hypothetical protein
LFNLSEILLFFKALKADICSQNEDESSKLKIESSGYKDLLIVVSGLELEISFSNAN